MEKQYKNWWTLHWLTEFQARWAGSSRAWKEGQIDFETGKFGQADFDSLSGELTVLSNNLSF